WKRASAIFPRSSPFLINVASSGGTQVNRAPDNMPLALMESMHSFARKYMPDVPFFSPKSVSISQRNSSARRDGVPSRIMPPRASWNSTRFRAKVFLAIQMVSAVSSMSVLLSFSRNFISVQQRIAVLIDGRYIMGRQRINLSAVDFSQQMLITGHSAQFPVPVCSGLNTPLFPVQLEKTGIRGDDFCDHCSSCHATPAVRAAFMISQIYLVRVADA